MSRKQTSWRDWIWYVLLGAGLVLVMAWVSIYLLAFLLLVGAWSFLVNYLEKRRPGLGEMMKLGLACVLAASFVVSCIVSGGGGGKSSHSDPGRVRW